MQQKLLLEYKESKIDSAETLEELNLWKFLANQNEIIKCYWKKLLDNGYLIFVNCEFNNVNIVYKATNTTKYNLDLFREQLIIRIRNPDGTNKTINFNQKSITSYDENGHRKAYVLDGHDRIINVLEYNNNPVIKANFETDAYNTSYEYDTSDNLVKITDALGNIFSFSYNSLGRRISLTDPDLGNWSYTYDLAGNLITQKQNGGGNL